MTHLTRIKELCEEALALAGKATEGPWLHRRSNDDEIIQEAGDSTGWKKDYPFAYIAKLGGWGYDNNNVDLLTRSRTLVPQLANECLKLIRALEKAIEQRDNFINALGDYCDLEDRKETLKEYDNKEIEAILEEK